VSAAWGGHAAENIRNRVAGDIEIARQPALQARQGMVDQDITPRHLHLELDHRCPAWWDQGGLHIGQGFGGQGSLVKDPIENLANDVEGGNEVRAAHAKENPHGFASFGAHAHHSPAPARRR
jgi:hypothetical protein